MYTIDSAVTTPFLRVLAKKGVCDVLTHIHSQKKMHYNEVMNYLLDADIIKSRSAVTTILNDLKKYGLLEKTIVENSPPGTCYSLNKKGEEILGHLKSIERIAKE